MKYLVALLAGTALACSSASRSQDRVVEKDSGPLRSSPALLNDGFPLLCAAVQDGKHKIGVVNLRDCFDKALVNKVKDLEAALDKQVKALTDELKARQDKIQDFDKKMFGIATDSPLYQQLRSDKVMQLAEYDAKKKLGELMIKEKQRAARWDVYTDILNAVKAVAQDQGLDLVLKADAPTSDEEEERAGVEMRILYHQLLYYNDALDITHVKGGVIERMNAEYAKSKTR